MKTELIHEIPAGAIVTVTLRGGTTFCGEEDTRIESREAGVLRLTKRKSDGRACGSTPRPVSDSEYTVFCCMHADVLCWVMDCED